MDSIEKPGLSRVRKPARARGDGSSAATKVFGDADNCLPGEVDDAPVSVLKGVGDLFFDDRLTIDPGDHDWYTFDVASGPPGIGWTVRIETFSDDPGGASDDTDLTLWGDCNQEGAGSGLIAFADDGGGNAPFMSRIDSPCLEPGDYYLEVGGFADISGADNFRLEIEVSDDCLATSIPAYAPTIHGT